MLDIFGWTGCWQLADKSRCLSVVGLCYAI